MPVSEEIQRAAEALRRGGLVAFPTETVYGLGADAENEGAVRRLFAAKGRPAGHPLIVHIGAGELLSAWALEVPDSAWRLAELFWPGPLTLILRRAPRIPEIVTGGLLTVGLRVPSHPVALALLTAAGRAVAAPSANRFGSVSPTTAEHVRRELGSLVDVVLDGGPCSVGVESTILDLSGADPTLLRPGGVTREELERALGRRVSLHAGGARAPGQLASHYAPRARVVLAEADALPARVRELLAGGLRVAVLGPAGELPEGVVAIPLPEDPKERARELYTALRRVDELSCDVVVTTLPPEVGLGTAVADRLRRAAGPRKGER